MFAEAIKKVGSFVRPIHTISRNYGSQQVQPGAATLFFVNELGVAITCKHVVELIGRRQEINLHYEKFKEARNQIGKNNKAAHRIKLLEQEFNYTEQSLVQLQELFVGVTAETSLQFRWVNHPVYDLSIIQFEHFNNPLYQSYATFLENSTVLEQGKYLCRLGFPFPEFTNYQFNKELDNIEWTATGLVNTPRFPIEGMLTRHLSNQQEIYGIEMSTPGLKGQSGGPLFDTNGIICGMQYATNHLHLGFDLKNVEYVINGQKTKVSNQPFLHVGHCIHVDIIKNFLRDNRIKFYTA